MKKVMVIIFVALCSSAVNSMGDGVVKGPGGVLEPRYVPLVEGQELFRGKVYDEKVIVELRELSFSGHTLIDGLRRESDDSSTSIRLADYKEIIIEQQTYQSKRYPDKELIVMSLVNKQGVVTTGYLAPCNLVICGIEKDTNAEKAWFLKKVDRITIERINESATESTNYVNKIFKEQPAQAPQTDVTKEQCPTAVVEQASLLDQTTTVTASQADSSSKIKLDVVVAQSPAEEKTFKQAVMGIFGGFADLIKAFFGVLKKIFRWIW
ncbi:MAG: hypothetical protein WCT20_00805 [Candidatus Babeliales bacterium]|jgi:hypothetical protein